MGNSEAPDPDYGRERMESPTKHSKSRSHHATSNVSSATHHAAKKLHKHALQNNYDRFGRLRDKHSAAISPSPLHHPGQAIADKISRTSNSKHGSRDASTGPSQTPAGEAEAAPVKMPRRPVKPADVARERQRRLRRDEELQSSLNGLADLAYDSNARLDDLFYGILEKVASLRSTIAKLQELSAASKKLHEEFESDTAGFEADFKGQIAAFGDFSAQGKTMGELEERIQSGMKRAQALSDRLEAARERVELWEKRENEWQARTSSTLNMVASMAWSGADDSQSEVKDLLELLGCTCCHHLSCTTLSKINGAVVTSRDDEPQIGQQLLGARRQQFKQRRQPLGWGKRQKPAKPSHRSIKRNRPNVEGIGRIVEKPLGVN